MHGWQRLPHLHSIGLQGEDFVGLDANVVRAEHPAVAIVITAMAAEI